MTDEFWKKFTYGYFILQTICLLAILDMLVFGKPFILLFLIIFGFSLYINVKLNKHLKFILKWPFIVSAHTSA